MCTVQDTKHTTSKLELSKRTECARNRSQFQITLCVLCCRVNDVCLWWNRRLNLPNEAHTASTWKRRIWFDQFDCIQFTIIDYVVLRLWMRVSNIYDCDIFVRTECVMFARKRVILLDYFCSTARGWILLAFHCDPVKTVNLHRAWAYGQRLTFPWWEQAPRKTDVRTACKSDQRGCDVVVWADKSPSCSSDTKEVGYMAIRD